MGAWLGRAAAQTLMAALVLLATAVLVTAQGVTFEQVEMAQDLVVGGRTLRLNGYGARRTGVSPQPASIVALYLDRPAAAPLARRLEEVLAALPALVVVHHKETLSAPDQVQVYRYFFTENCRSPCRLPWPAIQKFEVMLRNAAPGSADAFVIEPRRVTVIVGDRVAGSVEDEHLPALLLRVWLGDYAQTEALKRALLGGPPS